MSKKITIRRETFTDEKDIYDIYHTAFPSDDEAEIVEYLCQQDSSYSSWVADTGKFVVAHILYTKVKISGFENLDNIYGLAPMAVLPEYQGKGIGSKLILESLKELKRIGAKAVFVLGHKDFYPKFGFKKAIEHGFYYKDIKYSESFFWLELNPNYLKSISGEVIYHTAFDNL